MQCSRSSWVKLADLLIRYRYLNYAFYVKIVYKLFYLTSTLNKFLVASKVLGSLNNKLFCLIVGSYLFKMYRDRVKSV